jgi:hypothetical protein
MWTQQQVAIALRRTAEMASAAHTAYRVGKMAYAAGQFILPLLL